MAQIFQISDGTTTIDLLSPTGNYHLAKWESGISQWKDGGIFSENPLVDGRVPIDRAFDSVQEKITIHITGSSQDNVIASLRSLLSLFNSSYLYFAEDTGIPVYLIVKSDTETNTRYATIISYKIDKLPEQFDGPFLVGGKQFAGNLSYSAIYVELDIVIERDHWSNSIPGSSTNNSIHNQYTFNSTTYGQASTSADYIYVASQRVESNITHIYRYDSSAASWSSNLVGSTPPYNILPTSTTVNDAVYFGVQSSITGANRFHNLVFNIGTPASGITGAWELAAGGVFTGADGTQSPSVWGDLSGKTSFTKTGLGGVVLAEYSGAGWTANNLLTLFGGSAPNITGYWMRYRVTSVSSPTPPTQAAGSVNIFSCTRPYIEINTASIVGDLPALSKVSIKGKPGNKKNGPTNYLSASSIIAGVRRYSRGSLFTSYLNVSTYQNPSGITVSSSFSAITSGYETPSGEGVYDAITTTPGNSYTITWSLDSTIIKHFFGRYKVYVRSVYLSDTQRKQFKITTRAGDMDLYSTEYISVPSPASPDLTIDNMPTVTDMGLIDIPHVGGLNRGLSTDILNNLDIILTIKNSATSANGTGIVMDLVLIPADESIVEIREVLYSNTALKGLSDDRILEIDNVSVRSLNGRAVVRDISSNNITSLYRLINTKGLEIPTERSRLWFLYFDRYISSTSPSEFTLASLDSNLFGVKLSTSNRYIIPRGNI